MKFLKPTIWIAQFYIQVVVLDTEIKSRSVEGESYPLEQIYRVGRVAHSSDRSAFQEEAREIITSRSGLEQMHYKVREKHRRKYHEPQIRAYLVVI
jgi:hypothetical protein